VRLFTVKQTHAEAFLGMLHVLLTIAVDSSSRSARRQTARTPTTCRNTLMLVSVSTATF